MFTYLYKNRYFLSLIFFLIIVDQLTKNLATDILWRSVIKNFIALSFVYHDQIPLYRPVIALLSLAVLLLYTGWKNAKIIWPLIFLAGGGLSNSVEALVRGKVADFIFVQPLDIITNFADVFIGIGIIWYTVYIVREGKKCFVSNR